MEWSARKNDRLGTTATTPGHSHRWIPMRMSSTAATLVAFPGPASYNKEEHIQTIPIDWFDLSNNQSSSSVWRSPWLTNKLIYFLIRVDLKIFMIDFCSEPTARARDYGCVHSVLQNSIVFHSSMVWAATMSFALAQYGSPLTYSCADDSSLKTKRAPVGTVGPSSSFVERAEGGGLQVPTLRHFPSSRYCLTHFRCSSRYGTRFSSTSGRYAYRSV